MAKWINRQSPTEYHPHCDDNTTIYSYICTNCWNSVFATSTKSAPRFGPLSIIYYKYCPHCGTEMEGFQGRSEQGFYPSKSSKIDEFIKDWWEEEFKLNEELNKVKQVLEEAQVPKFWYSIDTPAESRISIICKDDGIHVFIKERGQIEGEKIYTYWYDIVKDVANSFELKYTEKVMNIAQKYLRS